METVSGQLLEKYHCFWNSAEKKGYSGVGIMAKKEPDDIKYGMGVREFDKEGRIIRADYGELTIVNAYIPSGSSGDVRQDIKMKFLAEYQKFVTELKQKRPHLILAGDFNICHKPIDIHNPKRHKNTSGFLPEEREWMDEFVETGFIDSFRQFHDEPEQYTWWSFRGKAREKNLGWRLDYQFVSKQTEERLLSASILSDVNYSDHCPVCTEIDF